MLSTLLALTCIVGIVLYYEAELRIRSVFFRSSLYSRLEYVSWNSPRLFFALARHWMGLRFIFESDVKEPLPSQFLAVSNHQSLVDIPVFFYYFREKKPRFVAKKELGRGIPLISQVLRYQGHCLVDRHADRMKSMKTIESFAKKSAARSWSPVIFPEGTRSRDGRVGTFHPAGVRRILELAPMPVVSIAIDGGWRFAEFGQLAKNVRDGTFRVKVLKVHPAPTTRKEASALVGLLHEEISAQVEAWHQGT